MSKSSTIDTSHNSLKDYFKEEFNSIQEEFNKTIPSLLERMKNPKDDTALVYRFEPEDMERIIPGNREWENSK